MFQSPSVSLDFSAFLCDCGLSLFASNRLRGGRVLIGEFKMCLSANQQQHRSYVYIVFEPLNFTLCFSHVSWPTPYYVLVLPNLL